MPPERQALINDLMLDMIANTDCSWAAATAAVAFWEYHFANRTAPIYGVVEFDGEHSNVLFDAGTTKRSLKIGANLSGDEHWFLTIQS